MKNEKNCHSPPWFPVMEVACGEYGDMVPSLVVATRNGKCEQYQTLRKQVNCEKAYREDSQEEEEGAAVNTKVTINRKNQSCDISVADVSH